MVFLEILKKIMKINILETLKGCLPLPNRGKTVVIVLGMHRSGTSCLTGTLEHYGLYLGDVVTAAPHNKKGNRENLSVMALNEELLKHNNASWDNPPKQAVVWSQNHADERDKIIQSYQQKIWGFKDPRVIFTLPFWLEGLRDFNIKFIGSFRNPVSVVRSIRSRNTDFEFEHALSIWEQYNSQLVHLIHQHNVPLVSFELAAKDYDLTVRKAMQLQDLEMIETDDKTAFFDDGLRNQLLTETERMALLSPLPEHIKALYSELERLAL